VARKMQTTSQNQLENRQLGTAGYSPKPVYELAKRVTETGLALLVLVIFSPAWLLVALAIRFTSKGPVLFRGQVVGRGGREFTYYKFRSMRHNSDNIQHRKFISNYVQQGLNQAARPAGTAAENLPAEVLAEVEALPLPAGPKGQFKLTNDNRITPVGRLIRKFSIDEIPQLINVIRGEMAIVGPRPPVPYEYSLYDDWARQRLTVRPGITGLAQVRMRGSASFRRMVELDLEYIEKRSYRLDWQILLKTPFAMLKGA
jgi:lipopolysaccharide/colanic/teichoic acid biosynthesis glycosyltransferase